MANEQKTKICKHCKTEIPYDAKICPHCRKRVKGGKLKWIIIVLVVLFLLSAIFGNDSGSNGTQKVGTVGETTDSSQSAENAETGEESGEEEVQSVYHVGDVLMDGTTKIVYMASGDYVEENEYSQPDDGYKYIFAEFAFENTSDTNDDGVSFYSFECYADGYACDMYYGGDEDLSATLSAGRATTGYLYFSVPVDAKDIEIEYSPNFFTSRKIKFAYEGEQDSGYELEKNTQASEDAFKVGDIVEASYLTISYLDNGTYNSDNEFIQPKSGYHYIYCEFEFENTAESDHDEYVSIYDFDCYADGINCDMEYISDAGILDATISAGHKAKGKVIFEVPDDAETVEVEFLTNYWTSNRIVFAYE
jgi:RNA polymerase subunit RPABC4/transcription elongation factor Spt4